MGASLPGAPTLLSTTSDESGHLRIAFDPPESDGGLPIVRYILRLEPGGREVLLRAAPFSPATVRDVVNGQTVTVRVAAAHGKGTGPWSSLSGPVTVTPSGKRWRLACRGL